MAAGEARMRSPAAATASKSHSSRVASASSKSTFGSSPTTQLKADEFFGGLSVSTAMRPERAAWTRSHQMPRYLISFDAHAMDHIPNDEMPAVARAAHEVVEEAMNAGVWVFGGGLENRKRASGPPTGRSRTVRIP